MQLLNRSITTIVAALTTGRWPSPRLRIGTTAYRRFAAGIVFGAMTLGPTLGSFAASADSLGHNGLLDLPMASTEAAISAATVVSEAPFQKLVQMTTCNGSNTTCFARLARVPTSERWAIQFVSCTAETGATATFRNFSVQVADAAMTKLLGVHFIAPTYQSDRLNSLAINVASQPMVLTAQPGNVIILAANSLGDMADVHCAVSGVRQRLR